MKEKLIGKVAMRVGIWLEQNKEDLQHLYVDDVLERLRKEKVVDTTRQSLLRMCRELNGEYKFKPDPIQKGGMATVTKQFPHVRSILRKLVTAVGEKDLGLTADEFEVLSYKPESEQD